MKNRIKLSKGNNKRITQILYMIQYIDYLFWRLIRVRWLEDIFLWYIMYMDLCSRLLIVI